MRTTSNPAFRNLPMGGQAGFQPQQQGYPQAAGYGMTPAPPTTADRPMTVDDVVTKTAATLGTTLIVGVITAILVYGDPAKATLPLIGGLIVGLITSLIIIFKRTPNPALVLTYAAAEGVFLGALTSVVERFVHGIALQAILGTALVFIVMLVVYRTGAIKVTPKLTKWIIGATVGAALLMLANLVLSMFNVDMGIRSNGPLAIGFSLLVIGIAAFNFLLDFDMADNMIRTGMPSKWAWYAAFGLMTTLVWLYLEILRLLWMLQSDN